MGMIAGVSDMNLRNEKHKSPHSGTMCGNDWTRGMFHPVCHLQMQEVASVWESISQVPASSPSRFARSRTGMYEILTSVTE